MSMRRERDPARDGMGRRRLWGVALALGMACLLGAVSAGEPKPAPKKGELDDVKGKVLRLDNIQEKLAELEELQERLEILDDIRRKLDTLGGKPSKADKPGRRGKAKDDDDGGGKRSAIATGRDRDKLGSAWIVDWDFEKGWEDAEELGGSLGSLQLFAAFFDDNDKLVLPEVITEWLDEGAPSAPRPERLILSVVNDIEAESSDPLAKDSELVSRLMATPSRRNQHMRELVSLLSSRRFGGLEIDYERVKDEDWSVFLDFCRDLAGELKKGGKRLRVVLEPNIERLSRPLPPGPEYVIMAYNLFGDHSGPGPKANAAFIENLYSASQASGVKFRLALSTGGFDWTGEGRARGLTEAQAAALAEKMKVEPIRNAASRYLTFEYTDDKGKSHEVWYADGETMAYLRRLARAYGFEGVDIWRLGGNVPESLAVIRKSLPEARDRVLEPLERTEYKKARTLYVSAGAPAEGTGAAADNPLPTIASAIAIALPGDTIVVAPGLYAENLYIDKAGLTITSPPGTETDMPVRVVGAAGTPTLLNLKDTVWRGVTFANSAPDSLVSLVNFEGRFEHCRFEGMRSGPDGFAVYITGGNPSFHASVFAGQGGMGIRAAATVPDSTLPNQRVDFTYCLIEGFTEGMLLATGDVDVRFANCVITRNGLLVRGNAGYTGEVNIFNSVLYFNLTADVSMNSPPVLVSHCLYTPNFNTRLWSLGNPLPEQRGVIVEKSRSLSPRFKDVGREVAVGIGIDDVANADVWGALTRIADEFGFKMTWAINTSVSDDLAWSVAREGVSRGHEVGTHTASHTPVTMTSPLAVAYYQPGLSSATLSIAADGTLAVKADGKVVYSVNLDDGKTTMAILSRELEKAGLRTLISGYYSAVPAAFLARKFEVDILFPKGNIGLSLDIEKFLSYELLNSLAVLKEKIPTLKEYVFIHPYSISSQMSKTAIARAGYIASRTGLMADDQGTEPSDDTVTVKMNVFGLPGQALAGSREVVHGNSTAENLRLWLDYIKLRLSAIVFYSHRWEEFSEEEWRELMQILKADQKFKVMTLAEMMRSMRERGTAVNDEVVSYTLPPRAEDYHPRPDSPMYASGRPLGLETDFAGRPVPIKKAPTIGLYQ